MLNGNERRRTMLRKLSLFSVVLTVAALMNSLAVNADEQNASDPPTTPLRGTVVGRELVYPNGVMVSLDAGTGLPSNELNSRSLQKFNLYSVPRSMVIPCSPGYTCLYQHRDFGGRRLQWRDRGQRINLTLKVYNFNDQMSSWINRNSVDARWFININNFNNLRASRCMQPGYQFAYVGRPDNDIASALAIYTDNQAC